MENRKPMENASSLKEEDWREQLDDLSYSVLRESATESPFTGKYYRHDDNGNYYCKACNALLFESEHKYDSGCGWPSFDQAVEGAISYVQDKSYGMIRTETKCANCNSHLGHVFDDGPQQTTGKRYCINSVCLDFDKKI